MNGLSYFECSKLNDGACIVFVRDWARVGRTTILAGTTGIVETNNLNEISPALFIRLDDHPAKCIVLGRHLDPGANGETDHQWQLPTPIIPCFKRSEPMIEFIMRHREGVA